MKKGNTALVMFGVVFAGVGLLFFIIGLWIGFFFDPNTSQGQVNGDPKAIGIFLMLFSSIFIAIGVWQIVKTVKSSSKAKKLIETGMLYWAEVSNIDQNTSIRVNGRSPYFVECWCEDAMGLCRNFTSEDIMKLPSRLSIGSKVAVYVNPDDDEEYYVDLSRFTPATVDSRMQYAQQNYYGNNQMYQGNMNYPNYPDAFGNQRYPDNSDYANPNYPNNSDYPNYPNN